MPVLNGLLPSGRTKTRLKLAVCYCLIPFLLSAFVAPSISWGQSSSVDKEVELEFWRAIKDSDDPAMMDKIDLFFHHFGALPIWFQTLWITVVASIFGIKGTQIFRNGGSKKK